jgi:hypothetical protein
LSATKNDPGVINQTKIIWLTDKEYVDSHGVDKLEEKKLDVDAVEVLKLIYKLDLDECSGNK